MLYEVDFVLFNWAVYFYEDEVGDDVVDMAGGMLLCCCYECFIFCFILEMKLCICFCLACGLRESYCCSIWSCNR